MNKRCESQNKKQNKKRGCKKAGLVICMAFLLAAVGCGNAAGSSGTGNAEGTTAAAVESDAEVAALEEVNQIPEDGIITKAQFDTVAGQDKTIRFEGQTEDGIEYVWIYDCSKIQNSADQNLKLEFETQGLDSVKEEADNADDALKVTMTQQGLICPPSLQVKLPGIWESDSCILVTEQNEELAKMCDVKIYTDPDEGDDGITYLTMTLTAMSGTCYVVGGISEGITAQADSGDEEGALWESSGGGTSGDGTEESDGSGGGNGTSSSGGSGSSSGSGSSGNGSSGSGSSGSSGGSGSSGSSGNKSSSASNTCTISINCATILDHMDNLAKEKRDFVPSDGWILKPTEVEFKEGDSVHDVLQQVCKANGIHMESSYTPLYNSAFVEGINQLYEFDCGELSGWTFTVNGWFPNYSCSKCIVSSGDEICWLYTCDLGDDVGSYIGH